MCNCQAAPLYVLQDAIRKGTITPEQARGMMPRDNVKTDSPNPNKKQATTATQSKAAR